MGKRKAEPATQTVSITDGAWPKLQAIFSARSVLRPGLKWFTSMGMERLAGNRLDILLGARGARKAAPLLEGLPESELRRLLALARINFEQAQATARLAVLLNITGVIAALVLSNQLFPGWVADYMVAEDAVDAVLIAIVVLIGVGIALYYGLYALGAVVGARDLQHVLEIHLLNRKADAEVAKPSESEQASVIDDLRSVQLSDI